PPPPPPPPPPPTDPMAIRILDTLERVCIPATAESGSLDRVARAAGFRRSRDQYILRQPNLTITVLPISTNGLTCTMQVDYPVDTLQPTIVAVHNWSIARGMTLRDPYRTTSDFQRDIRSWERDADALVLLAMKRPDGTPVSRNQDRAQVIYQRRQAQ
ncbi:MAG TPA: hypothetical protein VEA79_11395, partial [Phenylobacterium sp.]|nr:hypothetical protein [Phenylobacterium sp.]